MNKAKKLRNGSRRIDDVIKLKDPFKPCKYVQRFYTPTEHRLYKLIFESDVYVNPDLAKMKAKLKEMSDAIGTKFNNEIVMESKGTGLGYDAKFKKEGAQSFTVAIIPGEKIDKVYGKRKGHKFQITFSDSYIERTEEMYKLDW